MRGPALARASSPVPVTPSSRQKQNDHSLASSPSVSMASRMKPAGFGGGVTARSSYTRSCRLRRKGRPVAARHNSANARAVAARPTTPGTRQPSAHRSCRIRRSGAGGDDDPMRRGHHRGSRQPVRVLYGSEIGRRGRAAWLIPETRADPEDQVVLGLGAFQVSLAAGQKGVGGQVAGQVHGL